MHPPKLCQEFAEILDCTPQVFNNVCLAVGSRSNIHPIVLGRRAETAMFIPKAFSFENMDKEGKALCLGETVILQEEINPFIRKLQDNGIIVTAVHNHWLFDNPRLMYMHFELIDHPISFARKVKDAMNVLITSEVNPRPVHSPLITNNISVSNLCNQFNNILNGAMHTFENGNCVVMKTRSIKPTVLGRQGQSFLLSTEMYTFESMTADGQALCTGEIVLLQEEVNPFIRKLQNHGIIVTAVHNHWLFENPRLMYMHFLLIDYPIPFARKVRDALSVLKTR